MNLSYKGEDPGEGITGCISVVPAVAVAGEAVQVTTIQGGEGKDFHLSFLPDLHGATISGRVMHGDSDEHGPEGARVHFTLLGRQSTYSVARSDAYGNFAQTLPRREGKLACLVQPAHVGDDVLEERLDQELDPRV